MGPLALLTPTVSAHHTLHGMCTTRCASRIFQNSAHVNTTARNMAQLGSIHLTGWIELSTCLAKLGPTARMNHFKKLSMNVVKSQVSTVHWLLMPTQSHTGMLTLMVMYLPAIWNSISTTCTTSFNSRLVAVLW